MGTIHLQLGDTVLTLNKVMYVPSFAKHMISTSRLVWHGNSVIFLSIEWNSPLYLAIYSQPITTHTQICSSWRVTYLAPLKPQLWMWLTEGLLMTPTQETLGPMTKLLTMTLIINHTKWCVQWHQSPVLQSNHKRPLPLLNQLKKATKLQKWWMLHQIPPLISTSLTLCLGTPVSKL